MAVEVSWFLNERVIRWDFSGKVTVRDIQAAEVKTYVMMQNSPSKSLHVICDLHNATRLPSVVETSKVRWILPSYSKNATNVLIGLKNPMLNIALKASYTMSKTDFKVVPTLTDALQYLQAKDESLPNLFLKLQLSTLPAKISA